LWAIIRKITDIYVNKGARVAQKLIRHTLSNVSHVMNLSHLKKVPLHVVHGKAAVKKSVDKLKFTL
jgi:hypothetical protein